MHPGIEPACNTDENAYGDHERAQEDVVAYMFLEVRIAINSTELPMIGIYRYRRWAC